MLPMFQLKKTCLHCLAIWFCEVDNKWYHLFFLLDLTTMFSLWGPNLFVNFVLQFWSGVSPREQSHTLHTPDNVSLLLDILWCFALLGKKLWKKMRFEECFSFLFKHPTSQAWHKALCEGGHNSSNKIHSSFSFIVTKIKCELKGQSRKCTWVLSHNWIFIGIYPEYIY